MTAKNPLRPGAWLGVIGGGQLGRMLTVEARRMGYRVCVLDPDPNCPCGQVADAQVVGQYADPNAARELAGRVAVTTYEFENINADAVAAAEAVSPVLPGSRILRIAQHRIREKGAMAEFGFGVPRFLAVDTEADLQRGLACVGYPAVLKTVTQGYDGKGQAVLRQPADASAAFASLRPHSEGLILEEFVSFQKELSVICARAASGETACFPASENIHRNGILDLTIAPARIDPGVAATAQRLAAGIAEKLGLVGLLCVEMFLTHDNRLLVNELAPRPHNSGHHTLDAAAVSQYEQLVRVMCGLPLGTPELLSPSVMVNLLGDAWEAADGQPDFAAAMSAPGVKLHLYGKAEARPGRKMGHLTAIAPDIETALRRGLEARRLAMRQPVAAVGV